MESLKKYYQEACKRRQEELLERYARSYSTSYRWQDLVEEAKKENNTNVR